MISERDQFEFKYTENGGIDSPMVQVLINQDIVENAFGSIKPNPEEMKHDPNNRTLTNI